MVAFPKKTGKERREGHHAAQKLRGNPKRSGGTDQDHGEGALGGPHGGGTGDLPGTPSYEGQRLLSAVTSLPWWGQWRTSKSPVYGRAISIPRSSLTESVPRWTLPRPSSPSTLSVEAPGRSPRFWKGFTGRSTHRRAFPASSKSPKNK